MPQPSRKNYFDVPNWWVESGPIPESGPMDKATRDALLQHLLGMSFYTAGPKPAIRDALLSLGLPPKRETQMAENFRHHRASREIIFVPVPCGGSPEVIRQNKPGRYPHQRPQHWSGPPKRQSKAEALHQFLRRIAEKEAEVRRMLRPHIPAEN
jgi:hypothetical protein